MGILSFSMFRNKVESGEKSHTIRFRSEPPKVGESMSIWWKSRTPERKMIGVTIITRVDAITIDPINRDVIIDEILLKDRDVEALSFRDGFETIEEFWEYFNGEKRSGFVIHWDPDYITKRRILPWILSHGGFRSERLKSRRQYTPSNGTDSSGFINHWCDQCDRDKNQDCPVLMAEMNDDKGAWFRHEGKGYCSVFKPKKVHPLTARMAASYAALETKGQLNLLNGVEK